MGTGQWHRRQPSGWLAGLPVPIMMVCRLGGLCALRSRRSDSDSESGGANLRHKT
jgi:hypothetical protein